MPCDIGEGFLGNPVGGQLDGGGQQWQLVRKLDRHPHAARVRRGGLPDCAGEAKLVEGRWPQVVYQPPHIGHRGLGVNLQFLQQRLYAFGIAREQGASRTGLQRLSSESRAEAIVKVTPQSPALLFDGGHQTLTRALNLGGDDN
jgi:hypothetical protein